MITTSTIPFTRANSLQDTIWYAAARMTFLATADDTDGQYAMIAIEGRRGTEPPPHVHDREDEAFYVLEGEMEFTVGSVKFHLKPGGFVFMPRGVPHGFRILTKTAKALLVITPAGFEEFFRRMGRPAESWEVPPVEQPSEAWLAKMATVIKEFGTRFV